MDGINQPEIKPNVQIFQKSFFQTIIGKIMAVFLGILILMGVVFSVNYFNIFSPPQLSFLPKNTQTNFTSTPVQLSLIPQNYGFKAGQLTFSCPVDTPFCQSGKLINSSVGYKAASNSAVLNQVSIKNLQNIGVLTNKQTGKKYFYESTISKDGKSCYTIAYTLPLDATFQNIANLDLLNNKGEIATLGSGTIKIEGQEVNILIQVRNSPIDPGIPCSLLKKSPQFFQQFFSP